jgi:predicted enzyme related to lactoylglutathione lyase
VDIGTLFSGIAVSNLDESVDWYERLFGRSADIIVNDDEVMWHVTSDGWIYVLMDPVRAGSSFVSLNVPDLDMAIAEIERRGLPCRPIEIVEGAGRKGAFIDPDGNTVTYLEVIAR